MKNKSLIWIGGIATALIIGGLLAASSITTSVIWQGLPLFALCCLLAFVVQWILFVPAFAFQTEKYFDLAGSLTYISIVLFVWFVIGTGELRPLLIGALVIIWAMRLGSFLFRRISKAGEDRRFRAIKPDFLQFLMTWTIQGLWVSATVAAGLAAMTSNLQIPLDLYALIGATLWAAGFVIEVVADNQKSTFRAEPSNQNRFINTGLWRWSRHPNYFGEILLWSGIAVIAYPSLQGWQYATLLSPVFVWALLTYVSGVRMLEHRAKKQWGDDPEYQAYRAKTPVLILMPPS